MQNINELIGIIKGINFDGVVNNKEIVRLQSWVDKNRNLAYDKREMELIKMVDSVLEDYVIDKEEKELMLTICREFLKNAGENLSHIYELNGIIEGVVCDGEVNEAEILCLKEWMDSYGDAIREHKPSVELCKAIDDILEDGIVTEEEQAEILDLLNTRIRNAQFENKLSYLCKLVRDKKNIGPDLIDILNNESAMNEIHSRAERNLMQAVGSYRGYCANQEIIVVSLVLIAMLEYDGNYYDSVRATYKDLYARYTEQKVEGKIRSILSKYKKQSDSGSRTRIINVALENAIVPQTFLAAYFEFIFDIYKLNFEYDLPEEPYEDFEFVFEGLRNSMLSDGDDISINVTQKTYKLIAATKQLISRDDGLDAVIKLSIIIVKLIDRRFWDKEIKIFNPYLKAGYEGWEKTLKESARGGYERKRSDSEIRSRWEPKILMHNNAIYLNPPAHRVKSQYEYRDIAVVVFNDGEEIYRNNNCDIREIIGGYQVNTEKIEITKPLGKLTYRLVAGSEIIYDSKDKLHRNCIVFNNEGQEINNNTDFEGTAYIVYKKGEATIDNILTKENYCIGYKLVRLGDAIEIGHDVFNFSSMAKPGIFGQLYPNCVVQKEDEDKVIPVYHDTCFVVFEADNNSTKFEIDINGKPHKLGDMQYKATEKTGSTKYVVELDLRESGIYEIEVMQLVAGSKNRILQADMAYDMELTYSKNMLDDSVYRVQVSSNLLQHSIDTEIKAEDFHPGFIQFDYAGECYSYYLPFDFGFYKLSGCEWCSLSEDLWIDDINDKSVLTLYDSECDGLLLYTEGGTLAEDDIKLVDRGYYKQLPVRRLTGLAPKRPQFILTSATLGQQGKSEADIIKFAKSLTSAEYEISDIIFSKRIPLQQTPTYRVKGSDYQTIKDNMESLEEVKNIAGKYYSCNAINVREVLFELLSRDENVHALSALLKSGSKEFNILYNELYEFMSKEELIALIDIINAAEKDGIGLFDLKYHSFVRPLSGAYITYGKESKLSLTKTNEIDGMKAFEVGNCRYCNSPYIIGKIQRREADQMDYLLQNKEIDIYENYGNDQYVKIDYFLLENAVNEEEVDKEILEEYSVCAKCGEIHAAGNLNAKKCKCGDEHRFVAYRVMQEKANEEDSIFNNISQCPCCGHKGKSGVVKALNMGKDEGTALIAQMLYEAIDEGDQEEKQVKKISLKPMSMVAGTPKEEKVKQYLAFSDSRQQASFAAVFFDANHVRMLRKRLIWEMIVQNGYKDMGVDELASYLTESIKTKDLFQNDMGSHKNAWAAILVDLLRVDGAYDGEGLGLYFFDLDIHEILNEFSDEDIEEAFAQYNCKMNKEELNTLMQVVLGVFKVTPAINYVKSTLTPEEKKDILEYRRFNNYVMFNCPKTTQGVRSFLPVKGEENMVVRYNCLRNYYNQSYHNKLVRKLAIEVIKRILFEIDGVSESYQNERWHWNSQVSSSKKKMKLILGSDGGNPGTETADEIWSDLLDDCFDNDEIELITAVKESSPESISKPYYSKTVKIEETGENFTANLIWDQKQVILFLNDAYDDYLLAKKTGWNVYCTKEGFDVAELLEKVGE